MPQVILGNKLLHLESQNSHLVVTKRAAPSEGVQQPQLPVQFWESSTSGDTAGQQWTLHLTLAHHLKIYFCSFTSNIQQGTDSSHIYLKTTQQKDLWATNENSCWLLSNPAVIYTSLWHAKLLKSILVKKKVLPRRVKALAVPWGEATAADTVLGVAQMPLLCCSTRDWGSDEQVKNNLKNRDKNIPTHVKCGINITNTILCAPVPGQVWRSCLSAGKNEAEIENECLCVWNTSCKIPWISPPSIQCSAMIFLAHFCWVELGNHHFGRNCRNEDSLTTSFLLRAGGTTQNEKLQEHI